MNADYDFSVVDQGRFYRPVDELEIPIYLDKALMAFFSQKAIEKSADLRDIVHKVLRKEMDLAKDIS
jgi:hypothetical protein